jgi:hypothetical protein
MSEIPTQFSDRRLKTNIELIKNALDKMLLIHGYTYNRLADSTGKRGVGVIAQEVKTVLPEAVFVDRPSGMFRVSYGNLVALLIEAIRELNSKIEFKLHNAEKVTKAIMSDVFVAGEIVGIDVNGFLTKEFSKSISFAIIAPSHPPSLHRQRHHKHHHKHHACCNDNYDETDSWCNDETQPSLLPPCPSTANIAVSGKSPVILATGFTAARGDYLVATVAADGVSISGAPYSVGNMTFETQANCVGRVVAFQSDGKPCVRVMMN